MKSTLESGKKEGTFLMAAKSLQTAYIRFVVKRPPILRGNWGARAKAPSRCGKRTNSLHAIFEGEKNNQRLISRAGCKELYAGLGLKPRLAAPIELPMEKKITLLEIKEKTWVPQGGTSSVESEQRLGTGMRTHNGKQGKNKGNYLHQNGSKRHGY